MMVNEASNKSKDDGFGRSTVDKKSKSPSRKSLRENKAQLLRDGRSSVSQQPGTVPSPSGRKDQKVQHVVYLGRNISIQHTPLAP